MGSAGRLSLLGVRLKLTLFLVDLIDCLQHESELARRLYETSTLISHGLQQLERIDWQVVLHQAHGRLH